MNLPNILTVFRLGLIPVYFLVFFSDWAYNMELALFVIFLAGATDILDGYLARTYGMVTELGSMLDPLADKLMMLSVVLSFVIDDRISWLTAGLLFFRDLGMILASVFYVTQGKKTVPATVFGKANTVLYYLALLALLFRWPFAEGYLWIVIILSFVTSFHYLRRFNAMNI